MVRPLLIVVGTRPEGIKMIPVYQALVGMGIPVKLCSTSQHDELLTGVFELFGIKPDIDLRVMRKGQDLFHVTSSVLLQMRDVLRSIKPHMVLVQGDTTTTMAVTLAAFYERITIGHVEAGLRTNDMSHPFPEEMNRRFVSLLATYHFAPTAGAAAHVLAQGVHRDAVFCTGNTVVDALHTIIKQINDKKITVSPEIVTVIKRAQEKGKKVALLTMHRRESFGGGIEQSLRAIGQAINEHKDIFVIYPVHPNPAVVKEFEQSGLAQNENVWCCDSLLYHDLVHVLSECDWVMTDSGGIQEEAVSLGKPTLILRSTTERIEGVWTGLAFIVGTDPVRIQAGIDTVMSYQKTDYDTGVYGDGCAAQAIARIVAEKEYSHTTLVARTQGCEQAQRES